jgi:hypothetical protein
MAPAVIHAAVSHILQRVAAALEPALPPPTQHESELIARLRDTIRALPPITFTSRTASEAEWLDNANRLRTLVLNDDPRRFLRWDVIRKTMFIGNSRYVRDELAYLKSRPDWDVRWQPAIRESSAGRPPVYGGHAQSSANLIHHAYHLANFEETARVPVTDFESVIEFGGGYGSMCRLFHNLGFKGRYVIYDLPHMSALQEFYLKCLGLPASTLVANGGSQERIDCISSLDLLAELVSDWSFGGPDLFLATWSLSEAPVSLRNRFLPMVIGFSGFLIAYQHRFGEVDNVKFFRRFQETQHNVRFHRIAIRHLTGHEYLFGTREGALGNRSGSASLNPG